MNKNDIIDLQNDVKNKFRLITEQIDKKKVDKVLLKNILENFRSILDYAAVDISNTLKEKKIKYTFHMVEN